MNNPEPRSPANAPHDLLGLTPQAPLGWLWRYGFAGAAVLAAWILRLSLEAWVGPGLPTYVTFYPMVMVAALLGGFGPGLLATASAGTLAMFFILPPLGDIAVALPVDRLGLAIFLCMGLFMSLVARFYRSNRAKAAAYDREQELRELNREKAFLADLLENADQPFAVGYPDGRLGLVNRAFEQLTGYTAAELRTIDWSLALTPPEWRKSEDEILAELQRLGQAVRYEKEYLRKDGARVPIELQVNVVLDATGKPEYYYSFVTDISERKRTEAAFRQKENELTEAQRLAHIGSWHWDAKSDATSGSDELLRIYGFDPASQSMPDFSDQRGRCYPVEDWEVVNSAVQKALETGCGYELDVRVNRDHRQIWVTTRGEVVRDGAGRIIGMHGTVQDISERKRAEETLRDNELKASALINVASESIWLFDLEDKVLAANNTAARRVGLSVEEVVGRNWQELIPPALAASRKAMVDEVVRTGNPAQFEDERAGMNFDHNVYPVRNSAGELVAVAFFSRDVTERKRTEQERERLTQELRQRANELDTVFKALPVIVSLHANDGTYLRVNPALTELFGFDPTHASREEIAGRVHARFPDGRPLTPENMPSSRVLRGETLSGVEYLVTDAKGEERVLLFNAVPLQREGQVHGMVLAQLDITERKNAEEKLRASEARYRVLADTMLQGVVHQNAAGEIVSMNPAAERILGKTREQFLGSSSVREEHDTIRENGERFPGIEHPSMLALRDGQPLCGVIMGVFNPKLGEYRWISIDAVPVFSPGETQPSEVYTVFDDITLRKRAEEALRVNEKKLSGIYATMSEGLALHEIIYDTSGKAVDYLIVDVNPAFEMITGLQRSLAIGQKASALYATGAAPYLDRYAEVAATGKSTAFEAHFAPMHKYFHISAFSPDKGKFATIFQDITERKEAETKISLLNEQLARKVNELEEVNQELEGFTYSVSHDLRAPIRHIAGFAKVLERKSGQEFTAEARKHLAIMAGAADRLGILTDELLEFSRMGRKELGMARVALGALVGEVVDHFQKNAAPRRIAWRVGELPVVNGDATMLRFVFENLIGNAVKFTGKCAEARIEIGCREDEQRHIIFIRDNGVGFDMAYYDKLFGVFHRLHSKDEFEGTGIGLANVQRIIHRHAGEVWAESSINAGATFYFSLPKNTPG